MATMPYLTQLLQALAAALAVAVPLTLRFIRARERAQRSRVLLRLLAVRESLEERLQTFSSRGRPEDRYAITAVRFRLSELEREIKRQERPEVSKEVLFAIAGFEVFVLGLFVFNYGFGGMFGIFEGNFRYAGVQFGLVLVAVSVSAYLAIRSFEAIENWYGKRSSAESEPGVRIPLRGLLLIVLLILPSSWCL